MELNNSSSTLPAFANVHATFVISVAVNSFTRFTAARANDDTKLSSNLPALSYVHARFAIFGASKSSKRDFKSDTFTASNNFISNLPNFENDQVKFTISCVLKSCKHFSAIRARTVNSASSK